MPVIKQTHLRVFITVAELGSVSAAAQRLHRSPSAVSMTVAKLEVQLDRSLFEADGKSRLTPFGRYVYDVAREQIRRFDHVTAGIEAYARNDVGQVEIATVPSFAMCYLPGLLAAFIENHPQIALTIRDNSSAQINQLIDLGDIDFGIAGPGGDMGARRCEPLTADQLGVVCSRSHSLARLKRPLVWNDLRDQRFIANGTCALIDHPEFRHVLAAAEVNVQNTTSLLALVAAGVGVTTLPRLAVPAGHDGVVFKPTAYPELVRTIGLIMPTNRSLTPAASALAAAIADGMQALAPTSRMQ